MKRRQASRAAEGGAKGSSFIESLGLLSWMVLRGLRSVTTVLRAKEIAAVLVTRGVEGNVFCLAGKISSVEGRLVAWAARSSAVIGRPDGFAGNRA